MQIDSPSSIPHLKGWDKLASRYDNILLNPNIKGVHIAIVGKYTGLSDAYLSVKKALQHAALKIETKIDIDWVESTDLELSKKEQDPEAYEAAWKVLITTIFIE